MKKLMRFVCMLLVVSMFFAIPAHAQATVEQRGSAFFDSYGTDLYKTSSTSFEIWFDVDSNLALMDVIGVSEIIVYRSTNQQSWTKAKIYYMNAYPAMTDTNAYTHAGYVTYNYATPGYYYRAYVTFYAKNSTGIGERYVYTGILHM